MIVVSTVKELLSLIRSSDLSPVGLVPTMGALHNGHLSLVRNALKKCRLIIVSIYVNPTQFNDKEDLRNYPRTLNDDLSLLGKVLREKDLVFTPDDTEIYPVEDTRVFQFGNLDRVMEAQHRPGHFNGVGQVVSRLFEIVNPDYAWFGQKDFQQLAVIKELVRQTGYKVKVIGSPIVREKDGLAMSSRNRLLDPEIRKEAPVIYRTLSAAAEMFRDLNIGDIKNFVKNSIDKIKGFEVEYFEIVDDRELIPVKSKATLKSGLRYYGCIAVKAGKIRLIDNIEIPLNQSKG